jgi:dolichol-phosphate mannosyltransferase
MSKCAGLSLYYLAKLPTHDATNSFKLYRTSFLKQQNIESTGGFELGLELVVKAHLQGFKIIETPTTWTDRQAGKSNFKIIEWLPSYLKWYFMAFNKIK